MGHTICASVHLTVILQRTQKTRNQKKSFPLKESISLHNSVMIHGISFPYVHRQAQYMGRNWHRSIWMVAGVVNEPNLSYPLSIVSDESESINVCIVMEIINSR
jgi:hypothetical protein